MYLINIRSHDAMYEIFLKDFLYRSMFPECDTNEIISKNILIFYFQVNDCFLSLFPGIFLYQSNHFRI